MQAIQSARAARGSLVSTSSASGQSLSSCHPRTRAAAPVGSRTAASLAGQPAQCSVAAAEGLAARKGYGVELALGTQQSRCRRSRRGAVRTAAVFKTFEARRSLTMDAPPENKQFPMQLYLQDTVSIVNMSFPDTKRRSQVAPDKWRVQLLPIQFLWTTIRVSCTVRAWGDGQQLQISGRELYIDGMPPELGRADSVKLAVDGQLKAKPSQNRGMALNGNVRLAISADIPDLIALSPGLDTIVVGILDSILGRLQESISRGIIADYDQWQRKRMREAAATPAGRIG